jgi:glutaredoxin
MAKPKSIYVVYANWCPHCVPTTVEPLRRAGQQMGIPVHLLDIDTDDEEKADELVKKHGDWTPDYIIPQVFFEMEGGEIKHVLTGHPEGVAVTRRSVEDLLKTLSND